MTLGCGWSWTNSSPPIRTRNTFGFLLKTHKWALYDMTDEPLIFTSKGNVPISTLRYEHRWQDNEKFTMLQEFWFDGDEIVKNNVHVMAKEGLSIGGQQAQMQ
jgi:hypothetical protein